MCIRDSPKAVRTIGTGDGPYGPIQTDRFHFQTAQADAWPGHSKVALDAQGAVGVTDVYGVKLFNWEGAPKRDFSGIWGQYIEAGAWRPGEALELIDLVSMRTMKLDEKTGSWNFDVAYQVPTPRGFELDNATGHFFLRDNKLSLIHI